MLTKRSRRSGLMACALVGLVAITSVVPYASDSAEIVRLRNALVLDNVESTRFDWAPAAAPADFAMERAPASPAFRQRVRALGVDRPGNDWQRALAIGRHLLENRRSKVGDAIESDLEGTYRVIRATGGGYCGDYTRVYSAMALAAGLTVRSWAFSFDGFGGHGHVFNEVWDSQSASWRMIDVFHNYVVTAADGRPLSALEFRDAILHAEEFPRLVPIEPSTVPVFEYERKAREFYRRGMAEWYLWWGNQVFSYDNALLVRVFGPVSRALEQLGGIAQGVYPHIRVVVDDENRSLFRSMHWLKVHLLVALAAVIGAIVAAAVIVASGYRARRQASTRIAEPSADALGIKNNVG